MAYKSCAAQIAANIQQDCERPLVGGYTGRVVIIRANDFARAEVVVSADNPREIMSIVFAPDADVKTYYIDNAFTTPLSGSSTAGNSDSGRNAYQKTLAIRVPMRGADVSRDVIEPLVKSADGFVVIAEKRDKVGDGSYEVIGYQNSLRGDIASVTRDENANGGDWLVNLVTVETWAEVDLVGSAGTYESAKKEFENLLGYERLETRLVFVEGENQLMLSANGLVVVESIQGGEKVRETYSALSSTIVTINSDTGTEVVIYGAVTRLFIYPNYPHDVLESLDISKNTALIELYCAGCTRLTSLDLSKNNALDSLQCYGCTGLTSLDVLKNVRLTSLNCSNCTGLTSLDLSKNNALTYLYCNNCTGLTSLDVSKNVVLTYLDFGSCTGLSSIDVSKNVELTHLDCNNCTGLASLDLSKNIALTYLSCYYCTGLSSLDVSKNVELTHLDCNSCTGLASLDLSKNIAIDFLNCYGCTGLMLFDIANLANIKTLNGFSSEDYPVLTTIQVNGSNDFVQNKVEQWLPNAQGTGMLYVDENTNQSLIAAAESADWEVIYQS